MLATCFFYQEAAYVLVGDHFIIGVCADYCYGLLKTIAMVDSRPGSRFLTIVTGLTRTSA